MDDHRGYDNEWSLGKRMLYEMEEEKQLNLSFFFREAEENSKKTMETAR